MLCGRLLRRVEEDIEILPRVEVEDIHQPGPDTTFLYDRSPR